MALAAGKSAFAGMQSEPPGIGPLEQFAASIAAASDERCRLVPIPLDGTNETVDGLAAILSDDERRRAARFFLPRDSRRYIVAHGRLRQLLGERLGIRPEQVALASAPYGKPELTGRQAASGWRFNLSYSDGPGGGLAVCALSRWGRIGVDLEAVRPLEEPESLARHFFSPWEYRSYRQLPPGQRLLGFFSAWTRKEAFVKAVGTGLSHNLADFDISLAPGLPARILRVGHLRGDCCGWRLESIGPVGGRLAAVVTEQTGS